MHHLATERAGLVTLHLTVGASELYPNKADAAVQGSAAFTLAITLLGVKTWVRVLAYGAAGTVTVSRFMAHDHWSAMLVGSVLGFAIGTHIFHSGCDPELSPSCHRRTKDRDQP